MNDPWSSRLETCRALTDFIVAKSCLSLSPELHAQFEMAFDALAAR